MSKRMLLCNRTAWPFRLIVTPGTSMAWQTKSKAYIHFLQEVGTRKNGLESKSIKFQYVRYQALRMFNPKSVPNYAKYEFAKQAVLLQVIAPNIAHCQKQTWDVATTVLQQFIFRFGTEKKLHMLYLHVADYLCHFFTEIFAPKRYSYTP